MTEEENGTENPGQAPQERTPEPEYAPELGEAVEADDAILGLISSTMEAFRQGR